MDHATGATRPRAALEPAELADLLLPFVDKPSFIDYGDDLKKSTVQVEKFNNHMWKAALDRCPSPAFKQSVVVSALLIIRDKMDKWKMPEHKTRRWAATFAQRFRTQAKHLMNGLRQNSKWALRIKNGGNKKPTFQDPHAEEVDMGDEGEEGDHDDHDMEDALSAGEGSSDDCASGDDAPYEETGRRSDRHGPSSIVGAESSVGRIRRFPAVGILSCSCEYGGKTNTARKK